MAETTEERRAHARSAKRTLSVALLTPYLPSPAEKSPQFTNMEIQFGISGIQGRRQTMEDAHIALPVSEIPGAPVDAFFGVYDGHGGQRCADYIAEHFHKNIMESEAFKQGDAETAIKEGATKTDKEFLAMATSNQFHDGSTAVVAMIHKKVLTVGNVGDSEAVLCHQGKPMLMSTIHNPKKSEKEVERVKAAGGRIWNSRVSHPCFNPAVMSIAVSRAFGDLGYKAEEFTKGQPSGLTCEPDVKQVHLTPDDRFLILACDGLWDVMTYEAAVDYVSEKLDEKQAPQAIAEGLANWAYAHGSQDNITVLILTFVFHQEGWSPATSTGGTPGSLNSSTPVFERRHDTEGETKREDHDYEKLMARVRFLEEECKSRDVVNAELKNELKALREAAHAHREEKGHGHEDDRTHAKHHTRDEPAAEAARS